MMNATTPKQIEWAQKQLHKRMTLDHKRVGYVVDYKMDTVGLGVYLVVKNLTWGKTRKGYIEEYEEVFKYFPKYLTRKERLHKP